MSASSLVRQRLLQAAVYRSFPVRRKFIHISVHIAPPLEIGARDMWQPRKDHRLKRYLRGIAVGSCLAEI